MKVYVLMYYDFDGTDAVAATLSPCGVLQSKIVEDIWNSKGNRFNDLEAFCWIEFDLIDEKDLEKIK